MSRQDKATTERNARTLREFVKRPENKVCADCKRNDPRWASWNLGVYLCIRCSGIHRGMGTHISKVKSIDLDAWTPDQMQSIEKWGNRRANLYWEAHLKPGHVPPEHKMESFIRSKYETRRWALDGPPPSDPSVLEDESGTSASTPAAAELITEAPPPQIQVQTHAIGNSVSRTGGTQPLTTRQPQPHQLLSTAIAGRTPPTLAPIPGPGQAQTQTQAQAQKAIEPENDLFSLDFHAPSTANNTSIQQPRKDMKNDILSLFSTPAQTSAPAAANNVFGQFQSSPPASASSSDPWGSFGSSPSQVRQPQTTSMIGTTGAGAWGASSGWTPPAPNVWGTTPTTTAPAQQQRQSDLFGGNVWGSSNASGSGGLGNGAMGAMGSSGGADLWGSAAGGSGATGQWAQAAQKKDDAFGDLWGGFK